MKVVGVLKNRRTLKFRVGDFAGTAERKDVFSKGDATIYSLMLYTISDVINVIIKAYHTNDLLDRYVGSLLKNTVLTVKKN